MEMYRVFGILMLAYAFIRFLPGQKRRFIAASIPISVVLFLSFSYKNDITDSVIQLFNSGNIFYVKIFLYLSAFFTVEIGLSSVALKSEGAIELSLLIDFVKILRDSIKLVSKNSKALGLVTTLSLVVPSIMFSTFTYLYEYLINLMANSSSQSFLPNLLTLLIAEAAFVVTCSVIFQLSAIATISITAVTHQKKKLSLNDLFSRMKRTWRRQVSNCFSGSSRNPTRSELFNGALSNSFSVTAIFNLTFALILIDFQDPAMAVWPLSSVVSVVEECSDGGEAVKKAVGIVEGERVHGFMLKLLFLVSLVYCLIVGESSGPEIDLRWGLLLLNSFILGRIVWCILYTLVYFRCKKVNDVGKLS